MIESKRPGVLDTPLEFAPLPSITTRLIMQECSKVGAKLNDVLDGLRQAQQAIANAFSKEETPATENRQSASLHP